MSGLDFFVISVSFLSFLFLVDVCYFIWFWPCWVVIAAWAFSLVAANRGYSLGAVHRCLVVVASLVAEHGL